MPKTAYIVEAAGQSLTLVSDGSNWIVLARYYPPPSQVAT